MSDETKFAPFLQNPITKAVFVSTPDLRARGDLTPCWSIEGAEVPPPTQLVFDLPQVDLAPVPEPAPAAAPAPVGVKRTKRAAAAAAPEPAPEVQVATPPEPPTPEQFAAEVAAQLEAAKG